ncbi:MAG: NnrS family protein, partial [Nitrospirota bacterium]
KPADAVHALTTGAVGAMTLAVMTRASLGHTGRPKQADSMTIAIYILVNLGALLRVFGPAIGLPTNLVLGAAAATWSSAYLLFAAIYGPYLIRPSLDE